MFELKSGVPKPAHKSTGGNSMKYPLDKMEVGQFFVVPRAKAEPGDDDRKFRNRINQAVRTYKQRRNAEAHLQPGYNEANYTPMDFTVLTLGEPPAEHPDAWTKGDVGVWRDS